jgi:hypothetical protein
VKNLVQERTKVHFDTAKREIIMQIEFVSNISRYVLNQMFYFYGKCKDKSKGKVFPVLN